MSASWSLVTVVWLIFCISSLFSRSLCDSFIGLDRETEVESCPINSYPDSSRFCLCNVGYMLHIPTGSGELSCQPIMVRSFDNKTIPAAECSLFENSTYDANEKICICQPGHFYDFSIDRCRPIQVFPDSSTSEENKSSEFMCPKNSNLNETSGECTCIDGYQFLTANSGCKPITLISPIGGKGPLIPPHLCGPNAKIEGDQCVCDDKSEEKLGTCVTKKVLGLDGKTLVEATECGLHASVNSRGRCICDSGYELDLVTGLKEGNNTAQSMCREILFESLDGLRRVAKSECGNNTITNEGRCQCLPYFVVDEKMENCIEPLFLSLTGSGYVTRDNCGPNTDVEDGKCVCYHNYDLEEDGQCHEALYTSLDGKNKVKPHKCGRHARPNKKTHQCECIEGFHLSPDFKCARGEKEDVESAESAKSSEKASDNISQNAESFDVAEKDSHEVNTEKENERGSLLPQLFSSSSARTVNSLAFWTLIPSSFFFFL